MSARTLQKMKSLIYLYKVCSGTYASSRCYSSSFKCMYSVKKCITLNSKPTNESFESRNVYKFPGIVKTLSRSYSDTVKSPSSLGTIEEFDDLCKNGNLKEAVGLLEQNQIRIDMDRYLFLMNKCGESQALEQAKKVHDHLTRSVPHLDVYIHNKILEMYSKCGSMEDAYDVFDEMPQRNLTSWDTIITHGWQKPVKEKPKEKEKKKSSGDITPNLLEFRAGDTSHPNHEEIYNQLWCLKQHMREAGYVAQTRCVLHDVDLESKEEAIMLSR